MSAIRDGRRDALTQIFERYQPAIWAFYRRRTPDRDVAAELTQDVFVAVLEAAPKYQPRGVFRSYLFGIAVNTLAAWRRRTRRAPASEPLADIDPPATPWDPDDVLWVRRALAALDPIDRDVLMLREYEALKYDEIADVLDIPVNTVRSRLFRARLAMKAQLDAETVAPRSHV